MRKNNLFKIIILPMILILSAGTDLPAEENTIKSETLFVEIGGSPNPVGSGARALGMGGAFIGVADDATAASWNPGGLIQLETPEISIVGAHVRRCLESNISGFPGMSGDHDNSDSRLNYLSAVYPFSMLNYNMIASLNLQHMYDFNNSLNTFEHHIETTPIPQEYEKIHRYSQEGGWYTLTPAFAVQLMQSLSMGISLNFWNNGWFGEKWTLNKHTTGTGRFNESVELKIMEDVQDTYDLSGFNWNIGILWNISKKLTLGAVYKSAFKADFKSESVSRLKTTTSSDIVERINTSCRNDKLEMPFSLGLGLSARFSDTLTFDIDVYHTKWSDYKIITSTGNSYSPITGSTGNENGLKDVEDTTQIRTGVEYLFLVKEYTIPLRAGIFYDPEPAVGSPDDFFGCTLGTGIAFKNIIYDMALQYRFGNDVRETILADEPATEDVDSFTLYMSLIYHF